MKLASIRILVALTLAAALMAFFFVPTPRDARDQPELPAIALEQGALYRLEVALAVFYGGLLLITPAYSGLVGGRLPVEISARGARFVEEASESVEATKAAIEALERRNLRMSDDLFAANLEVKRLNQLRHRDDTQPKVDSKL